MAQWVRKEFGNKAINDAAKKLAPWWAAPKDRSKSTMDAMQEAYRIVDNWRMSHAFPLNHFQDALRKRAKRFDPNVIVAQRLKRMDSVLAKLARSAYPVTTMQDLGGCRAILPSMREVEAVLQTFVGPPTLFPVEGKPRVDNYILNPKPDGYRGIHIVGRYRPKAEKTASWNGYRIEIQLRTVLQHACSTAVETVQTFTGQPLKFGHGSADWKRFFVLASSAFAMLENMPIVPGAPKRPDVLLFQLADLERRLRVRRKLAAWAIAAERIDEAEEATIFVLELRIGRNKGRKSTISGGRKGSRLFIRPYSDRKAAMADLSEVENRKKDDRIDAVLVGVGALNELRRAYPNYFADTQEFVSTLDRLELWKYTSRDRRSEPEGLG